jgi:hypothetical protein
MEKADNNDYSDIYSLMNYENNSQHTSTKWRAYAKLSQLFGGGGENKEGASSAIKNAYYNVQVDYSNSEEVFQSEEHKKNLFDYGYVGKFKSYSVPTYNFFVVRDSTGAIDSLLEVQSGNQDTLYDFTAGTQNPYTTNYTKQYYELTDPFGTPGYQDNQNNVLSGGGLINGDNRSG